MIGPSFPTRRPSDLHPIAGRDQLDPGGLVPVAAVPFGGLLDHCRERCSGDAGAENVSDLRVAHARSPGRLRAIDLLRSCDHLGQPYVGADGQRHEVVALVVTGVFLCCAALLVGGVVIVALLAVGRLVIRAGLIVSAWLLGASLDVAGRPVLGTVAIAARQVPTRARFGSVATLSRAPGGVFLARLHAGVLLRVDLVAVERHRTNVSISRVRCQGLWSRARSEEHTSEL